MKNLSLLLFFIGCLLFLLGCKKEDDTFTPFEPPTSSEDKVLTGYNVRWRNLAEFDNSNVLSLVDSLNPEILRYPGGTLAHHWNWETGLSTEAGSVDDVPHLIDEVGRMSDATDSKVIFVLDIVNSSISEQLEMLQAAAIPIEYIELGNELYADDYEVIFPDGLAYADTINSWVPVLRQNFPEAKIGSVMIGREAGNDRKNLWNTKVLQGIEAEVDAYIYHIYVGETETVDERMSRFYDRFVEGTGKELWITEYGAKSQNLAQALELATAIDAIANLSLNHCIVAGSGSFSKLTADCNALTEEGSAFVERYGE